MKIKDYMGLMLVFLFLLTNKTVEAAGLPQAGESSFNWLLILGVVVFVVALFILFGKKKKR